MAVPFLTTSYFAGKLEILNLTSTTNAGLANIAKLQRYIDEDEIVFLKYLLGQDLYDEFAAGIAIASPLTKWTNLKNQIYNTTKYISPAAGYVYWRYWEHESTITTQSGQATSSHENATGAGIAPKMVLAWNNMVEQCEEIWQWLNDNSATYTTFSNEFNHYLSRVNELGI